MKLSKVSVLPCLLAAAAAFTPSAHATTYSLQVLTAGSSAQFGVFAEAAFKLAGGHSGGALHYTVKSGSKAAWIDDTARNSSIPLEYGNLWVVWNPTSAKVWAYLSVDSTVGVRAFEAAPRAKLGMPANASLPNGANALPVWDDASLDQTSLPADVETAISGIQLTAANTDIRPEDALFATNRALAATTAANASSLSALGYDNPTGPLSGKIGTAILSGISGSTAQATPIAFALSGTDPISGGTNTVTAFVTLPVGAAPIVFIANNSNSASGHLGNSLVKNLTVNTTNNALKLFDGDECDASLVGGSSTVPVTAFLREPLSGTMNTTEYTNFRFRTYSGGTVSETSTSQEKSISTYSGGAEHLVNPVSNTACTAGSGHRTRGIGTGEIVTGVNSTADSIGYVFFAYEAVNAKSGGNAGNIKYLELDGVDPIGSSYSTSGAIPTCGTSTSFICAPSTPNSTYPNLRNGTYRAWSTYRMITDSAHQTLAQNLVTEAQAVVANTLPDFVPFNPVCGSSSSTDELGIGIYRAHFVISGVNPNDGTLASSVPCGIGSGARLLKEYALGGTGTISGTTYSEAGGDVGGAVVYYNPASGVQPTPANDGTHSDYINPFEGQNSTLPQRP